MKSWLIGTGQHIPEDLRVSLYVTIPYDASNKTASRKVSDIADAVRDLLEAGLGNCVVDDNMEVGNATERTIQFDLF